MLLIDYKPVDFPDKWLPRSNPLHCTWADLVWAAITVNDKPLYPTVLPQASSYWGLMHRITSVYAHLQTADYRPGLWGAMDTHLVQSSLYRQESAAEKSMVSTFFGHITAKLFAVKLLRTPWIFTLDPQQFRGLVGLTHEAQWVMLSVKGRSNRLEQRLIKTAAKMTQQVTIGGIPPQQQAGFFSYFTAITKTLKAYLVNVPLIRSDHSLNLDITSETFLRSYYMLLYDFLSADYGGQAEIVTFAGCTYRVKNIPEVDGQIGLDEKIYHLMQSGDKISPQDFMLAREKITSSEKEDIKSTVGQDGIFVRLGDAWRDDLMYLPPPERIR